MPADQSVDLLISNCDINLCGDKPRVLHGAARVLRYGGRFAVSEVLADEKFLAGAGVWHRHTNPVADNSTTTATVTSGPMPWEWPVGALCAFLLTVVTTPAGVSGAVLLLPIQLSILHVPSPAVTPTNLLFNVASIPGGLLRFRHERRLLNPLTWLLVAGTLPGVVAGAIIRVEWLSGGKAFELVVAGVLLPLGLWLMLGSQRIPPDRPEPSRRARHMIWALSLIVGTIGGIYGIGGGSLLAPILLILGFSAYEVAPATLAATFITSISGIVTYQILQATHGGAIAPDFILAAFLGAGGFAGSYVGARLQSRLPERSLRRLLGLIACLVAVRYLQQGIEPGPQSRPAAASVR